MSSDDTKELSCPRCGATLVESPRCPACGLGLEAERLFDPKHFHWLGVLFSGLVPITLSALNWGRVGRTRERNLWLILGFLGFVLLFTVLRALPPSATFLGFGVSAGLGYYLRQRQQPIFDAGLRLGAGRSSAWKGVLAGASLTICALAVVFLGCIGLHHLRFGRAVALVEEAKFTEADAVLERLLREDPTDRNVIAALALCRLPQGRWSDAARGMERYLSLGGADSATAYCVLALAASGQGRTTEAESLAARARGLDSMIFTSNYGTNDLPAILDSLQHIR